MVERLRELIEEEIRGIIANLLAEKVAVYKDGVWKEI